MPLLNRTKVLCIFALVLIYFVFNTIIYVFFGTVSPQDLLNIALSDEDGIETQPSHQHIYSDVSHVPGHPHNNWDGDYNLEGSRVSVATSPHAPDHQYEASPHFSSTSEEDSAYLRSEYSPDNIPPLPVIPTLNPTTPIASSPTPNYDDFRLLIGIMSPIWASDRRHIIRYAYSRYPNSLPVDVVFVQGRAVSETPRNADKINHTQDKLVEWENNEWHDIMLLDCEENLEEGKTYEFLRRVGRELSTTYTHVMKTDDDSFINIPALVEVIYPQRDQAHLYWGTTYRDDDPEYGDRYPKEMWGSGYILSMDLIEWISTSPIPHDNQIGAEDLKVIEWLIEGDLLDNNVINRTAFANYPWPELQTYHERVENEIRPFNRWTLVTHPLKEDFMWVDTAAYYLNLDW